MNTAQKQRIEQLRSMNLSYAKIADALGVSENTIQSFCRRNSLGGVRRLNEISLRLCAQCAAPLEVAAGNRKRRFCSVKCHNDWWNAHQEQHGGP